MCSLRLIKHSLKRSACCFLDAFLLLRARVFPPLAGPPSRKPGGTAARRSLCRIHRTWWWWRLARTRHTTETSKRIWSVGEKFQKDWSASKCDIWGQSDGKQDKKWSLIPRYWKLDISIVILVLSLVWSVWIASNLWLDTDSQPQSCQWTNPRHRSRIRCRSSPECGPSSSWVCRPARETTHNIVVLFVHDNV